MEHSTKNIFKYILVFGLFFLAIFLNMALLPSMLDGKEKNIKAFQQMFGFAQYPKVIIYY